MNCYRRIVLVAGSLFFAVRGFASGTGIGLVLTYEAKQWTQITWLDFDGVPKIGARGGGMHISDRSTAHEALTWPSGIEALPQEAHAIWRYKAMEGVDEAAQHVLHEREMPWREAEARVPLRSIMDPEVRALIDGGAYRPRLRLTFDHDRLTVRWSAELKL